MSLNAFRVRAHQPERQQICAAIVGLLELLVTLTCVMSLQCSWATAIKDRLWQVVLHVVF